MSTMNQLTKLNEIVREAIEQQLEMQPNDSVTLRTMHLRIINIILKKFGIKWFQLAELVEHYVPIHRQIIEVLINLNTTENDEEVYSVLSQDFVKIDKLTKFKFTKTHILDMQHLCAVDGIFVRHGGPVMDWKRYANNLKFPLHGQDKNEYDDDPHSDLKCLHVQAIRAMYDRLGESERDATRIYQVMYALVKENCDKELNLPAKMALMTQEQLIDLKTFYYNMVGRENFEKILELFKIKCKSEEKRKVIDEEKRGRKRKKTNEEENNCNVIEPMAIPIKVEEEESDDSDEELK